MDSTVARMYAKALMRLEGVSIEDTLQVLRALSDTISQDKKIQEFLTSPLVKKGEKFQVVVAPIVEQLDKKVVNLLTLMSQKNRLIFIPEMTQILEKELRLQNNSFEGVVESKEEIAKDLLEKLEKKLSNYANATIYLKPVRSEIDGVRVEVSDLGLELSFSKAMVKEALLQHIQKAL